MPSVDQLLKQAQRLSVSISITELSERKFELVWYRPYATYLASVRRITGKSKQEVLQRMIDEEEEFRLLLEHGSGCPCENCCVSRVDRGRRKT